jgi:hypothetical protein
MTVIGWNKCSDLFFYLGQVFFRSLFCFRAEHALSFEFGGLSHLTLDYLGTPLYRFNQVAALVQDGGMFSGVAVKPTGGELPSFGKGSIQWRLAQ